MLPGWYQPDSVVYWSTLEHSHPPPSQLNQKLLAKQALKAKHILEKEKKTLFYITMNNVEWGHFLISTLHRYEDLFRKVGMPVTPELERSAR